MTPIEFEGCNVKFAEHQEEYETLPAKVTPDGIVTMFWKLDEEELKKINETGGFFHQVVTFNQPLQPVFLTPFEDRLIQEI